MTDPIIVLRKLTLLREHLGRLRRRRGAASQPPAVDVDVQDAVAMSLMVVIQESLDIALHMAADEGWGIPSSYAEGFDLLAKHGVVSDPTATALGRMAALRNRIAHGYASVDFQRIWQELPEGIDLMEGFVAAIVARLG